MVKQTALVKELSGKGMAVASPSTTVTLVSASRAFSEAASRVSISIAVRRGTRCRSQSVVWPGPGPISRTASPRSRSPIADGIMYWWTILAQPGERQYQRWIRFIVRSLVWVRVYLLLDSNGVVP